MHRTNEANLSSITDNLEKLRECFGKWVNLSIESDSRVIVTSERQVFLKWAPAKLNLVNYARTVRRRLPREYLKEKN